MFPEVIARRTKLFSSRVLRTAAHVPGLLSRSRRSSSRSGRRPMFDFGSRLVGAKTVSRFRGFVTQRRERQFSGSSDSSPGIGGRLVVVVVVVVDLTEISNPPTPLSGDDGGTREAAPTEYDRFVTRRGRIFPVRRRAPPAFSRCPCSAELAVKRVEVSRLSIAEINIYLSS